MTEKDPLTESWTDHDILIDLRAEVRNMSSLIKSMTDIFSKTTDDHESRIRDLEGLQKEQASSSKTWRFVFSLVLTMIGLVVGIIGLILAFVHP